MKIYDLIRGIGRWSKLQWVLFFFTIITIVILAVLSILPFVDQSSSTAIYSAATVILVMVTALSSYTSYKLVTITKEQQKATQGAYAPHLDINVEGDGPHLNVDVFNAGQGVAKDIEIIVSLDTLSGERLWYQGEFEKSLAAGEKFESVDREGSVQITPKFFTGKANEAKTGPEKKDSLEMIKCIQDGDWENELDDAEIFSIDLAYKDVTGEEYTEVVKVCHVYEPDCISEILENDGVSRNFELERSILYRFTFALFDLDDDYLRPPEGRDRIYPDSIEVNAKEASFR